MKIFDLILNLIFPPKCAVCGKILAEGDSGFACAACLSGLEYIDNRTGADLESAGGYAFSGAFACAVYDGAAQKLIHTLKYYDRPAIGRLFTEYLIRESELDFSFMDKIDAIVPVPLHENRLRRRGYNQCAVIAARLGAVFGKELIPGALTRTRDTLQQSGLSGAERRGNVAGAFEAGEGVAGLNILLVDDVFTTGGTLDECAKALLKAGAKDVKCFTLTKTRFGAPKPQAPAD